MRPLAEGKTKAVYPATAILRSKDRVTWGNRWEADMPGKAAWSNTITCSVFELFSRWEHNVAYVEQRDSTAFVGHYCDMILLEVVGRSLIDPKSSFLKRNPGYTNVGVPLELPEVEFFLKSSGKKFKGIALPDDDPFIVYPGGLSKDGFYITHPGQGVGAQAFKIPYDLFGYEGDFEELLQKLTWEMRSLTILLRDMWAKLGCRLGDWKGEFGIDHEGRLLLADVIDNDSWRLRDEHGVERSKQVCRDRFDELTKGLDLNAMSTSETQAICDQVAHECAPHFAFVAEMSKRLVS